MKLWITLLLLAALSPGFSFQSRNAYKSFYKTGEEQLESGNHGAALQAFSEAFRLEPKPGRYREEGAFFRTYLPRYKIALAHEPNDIIEAEVWAKKSEEALEADVIQRRQEKADFHANLSRIFDKADAHRKALAERYDLALREAEGLLASKKFDEAAQAYEKLIELDPDRTEGKVGLDSISSQRENYLRAQGLDAQQAILDGRISDAKVIADLMRTIDPNHQELKLLEGKIKAEEDKLASEAETEVVQVETPPPTVTNPEPREQPRTNPPRNPQPAVEESSNATQPGTEVLRKLLLESLEPYRRGDPDRALAKLEEAQDPQAQSSPSYQWLLGVYTLAAHRYAVEPDDSFLDRARTAMVRARELLPGFQPDADLYPAYIIDFYQKIQ